ncbi:MAG: hypothetical protein U0790_08875 [Isosphaeraceae bacterium]
MNRSEWLASDDPSEMLGGLRSCLSAAEFDRFLVRYYLACCRRIWRLLPVDTIRCGVEAAERFIESEAYPNEARYWAAQAREYGYLAEVELYFIATFNSVEEERARPDDDYFSQAGRVRRWVEAVASVPPNKIRKMVRIPPDGEPPPPGTLLEDTAWFAFRAIYWAIGSSECRRGIEECRRFLCPHVLRETVHRMAQSSSRSEPDASGFDVTGRDPRSEPTTPDSASSRRGFSLEQQLADDLQLVRPQ